MGYRIQPREIDVPEGDPFENNLLGWEESANIPSSFVDSTDGPCVIAVDS